MPWRQPGHCSKDLDRALGASAAPTSRIFWTNLTPHGGDRPTGELASLPDRDFGSFDAFRRQLTVATTTTQGSGWGVLAWEPVGQRLIITQVYDHQGNVGIGSTPVLVFDSWEHAYYL
jgi:Fe-Mn family superoxide dismutase